MEIGLDKFRIQVNEEGERLITPGFSQKNETWPDRESLWMRSLHVDKDSRIISVGLPKFFNIGYGPNFAKSDQEELMEQNGVTAIQKIDGSLLIRFVQDGEVKFRTRGSFGIGLPALQEYLDKAVETLPLLFNPKLLPDSSLFFEWVSPKNQIVLKYDEDRIHFIGEASYDRDRKWYDQTPRLSTYDELIRLQNMFSPKSIIPATCVFTAGGIQDMINDIRTNTEIEGYVFTSADGQTMMKVKTDAYFVRHAMLSTMTTERMVDLWISWGKTGYTEFYERFLKEYDYACLTIAIPIISSMFDGIDVMKRIVAHMFRFLNKNSCLLRKEFAEKAKQAYMGEKLALCFMLLDGKPVSDRIAKKIVLSNCKHHEIRMFKKEVKDGD